MGVNIDTGIEKLGIFIKSLAVGGSAAKNGRSLLKLMKKVET